MTLLQSALLLLLFVWLLAMFQAYGYGTISRRMQRLQPAKAGMEELPPLSVVIPAHNVAARLRHNLPVILRQDYERFEVIVVDMGSTDDTKDVLEHLEMQYANLRHTFTPASAIDISLERLALTLGIRAASYEWVVITHSDCLPVSQGWLTHVGETIVQPQRSPQSPYLVAPDLILGQARYDRGRHTWLDAKANFVRLWETMAHVQHVLSGHAAVSADACNIAIRKEFFLSEGGFVLGQDLKVGACELFVNQTSTPGNTALMLSPAAAVVQQRLSRSLWKKQRLASAEIHRHQQHRRLLSLKRGCRLLVPWLLLLMVVPLLLLQSSLALGAYGLLLLIYITVKLVNVNRTVSMLGLRTSFPGFLIFELLLPVWDLRTRVSHMATPKNEFRKKFV